MRGRRRDVEILNHASFIDALFLFIGALIFILMIVVMLTRDLNLFELVAPGRERLPDATVGHEYEIILPIFGGNERYNCQLVEGALVEGLHLKQTAEFADGTCGIEGVPARVTDTPARLKFRIRDSAPEAEGGGPARQPKAITRAYELSVLLPPNTQPLQVMTRDLPVALAMRPYRLWLSAMGGAAPYRWETKDPTPPGLMVGASGMISGMPARIGTYPVEFRVTDAAGTASTWTSLDLKVVLDHEIPPPPPPPPVEFHTRLLPNPVVGHPYEVALSATGGAPPYYWQVEGELPPGLACCADGYLAGSPTTAGRARLRFFVRSSDTVFSAATSDSRVIELIVDAPPPTIDPLRLFR